MEKRYKLHTCRTNDLQFFFCYTRCVSMSSFLYSREGIWELLTYLAEKRQFTQKLPPRAIKCERERERERDGR